MELFTVICGLVVMALGFLAKIYPKEIASSFFLYVDNKHINLKGLASFLSATYIIIGLSIIVFYYGLKYFGCADKAFYTISFLLPVGSIIITIIAYKRYRPN